MTSAAHGGIIDKNHRRWWKGSEYMFPNLRAEMMRHNVTAVDISQVTHKTDRSIRDKIAGRGDFSLTEVYAIRDAFFPGMDLEYLFARNTGQSSA